MKLNLQLQNSQKTNVYGFTGEFPQKLKRRVSIYPTQTIPKNCRGWNHSELIPWGQHQPDRKVRKRYHKKKKRKLQEFPGNSAQFSHSVMSNSLWHRGLQNTRLPCPSPMTEAYSNSCPSSQWCHPTISSPVIPFSSHLQSFPATESPMNLFFILGGQSIGV